jgi:ubiquinone/menaquinone biosynthesis C-methylase UbiE
MTGTRSLIKFYDAEALVIERYASKYFWERRYNCKRMNVLNQILKDILPYCETFLDVGCGTGEYLAYSKTYSPQVYGVDISRSYLQRNKPHKISDLILCDIKALPFRDLSFDCVLCSEVIEHVKGQNTSIKEIFRIARNFVLVSTPNHGLIRIIGSRFAKHLLAQIDARVGHLKILKFSDLKEKFTNKEWKIIKAFTVHIFPPSLDTIHLTKHVLRLIDKLESFFDRTLPLLGTISIICLERERITIMKRQKKWKES